MYSTEFTYNPHKKRWEFITNFEFGNSAWFLTEDKLEDKDYVYRMFRRLLEREKERFLDDASVQNVGSESCSLPFISR